MSNHICEELVVEIFSRLPSKSLLRFRSVSKSLRACINSPAFIRLHTLRSPKKIIIIYKDRHEIGKYMYTLHSEDQLPYTSYVGITPVKYPFRNAYKIVGSCNGILCLVSYDQYCIILWNPSIRRKVIVRYPPNFSDCCSSSMRFGFGFDPVIDDYKILWISKLTSFVYTLKRGTWREISFPIPFSYVSSYQCLFNGALHFAVKRDLTDYHIIKFDLSSEVFSMIELPEPSWETSFVTIIDNRLAIMSSKYHDTRVLGVWVMRECNSWYAAFNLNTNGLNGVLQVTASNALLLHTHDNSILVYDPKTDMRSKLVNLNDSSYPFRVTMCIESLGLLDIGTPC